jgi:Uma2 family endonuclease
MATVPRLKKRKFIVYPTSDKRPMAETDDHRDLMVEVIDTLKIRYASYPQVYVSGNLLVFYEPGDRLRHLSPDVFVVKGVPKHNRENYLIWKERKGPDWILELTSRSTKEEDLDDKFWLYQDKLKVREYFLFDPHVEYLDPPLMGYRLRQGKYKRIRPVDGRLPSQVLGLHLEQVAKTLRLHDPATGAWLPTPSEIREQAEEARLQAEEENLRLRHELENLRRRLGESS